MNRDPVDEDAPLVRRKQTEPNNESSVVFPLREGPIIRDRVPAVKASAVLCRAYILAAPAPNETLTSSTARNSLGTEHPPRFDGQRGPNMLPAAPQISACTRTTREMNAPEAPKAFSVAFSSMFSIVLA